MQNLNFLMNFIVFGFFPESERWRLILILCIALSNGWLILEYARDKIHTRTVTLCSIALLLMSWVLAFGDGWLFIQLSHDQLSGLILNICLVYWSLPIATLFSMGSCYMAIYHPQLWPVRFFEGLCKIIRSIPLISLLFFMTLILPMMTHLTLTRFDAALYSFVIFVMAYVIEVFKGAYNAIDQHQHESAHALGIAGWQKYSHIDLPQIMKNSIPSLMNTYIGVFKDTTLVMMIGLSDSLGNLQLLISKNEYRHDFIALFALIGLLFWALCWLWGVFGRKLEEGLIHE